MVGRCPIRQCGEAEAAVCEGSGKDGVIFWANSARTIGILEGGVALGRQTRAREVVSEWGESNNSFYLLCCALFVDVCW